MKEKKLRVEDAVNATKAAVEEGIVPGGGIALLRAREVVSELKLEDEEKVGANILFDALEKPFRLIVQNAGEEPGKVLAELERSSNDRKNSNIGYNVLTRKFVDMIKAGITDPTKVARSALRNAVSVAIMVLTTECLVTDAPKNDKDIPGMPAGAGGMGGMGGMPGMM